MFVGVFALLMLCFFFFSLSGRFSALVLAGSFCFLGPLLLLWCLWLGFCPCLSSPAMGVFVLFFLPFGLNKIAVQKKMVELKQWHVQTHHTIYYILMPNYFILFFLFYMIVKPYSCNLKRKLMFYTRQLKRKEFSGLVKLDVHTAHQLHRCLLNHGR